MHFYRVEVYVIGAATGINSSDVVIWTTHAHNNKFTWPDNWSFAFQLRFMQAILHLKYYIADMRFEFKNAIKYKRNKKKASALHICIYIYLSYFLADGWKCACTYVNKTVAIFYSLLRIVKSLRLLFASIWSTYFIPET